MKYYTDPFVEIMLGEDNDVLTLSSPTPSNSELSDPTGNDIFND